MSRIGRREVPLPKGVTFALRDGRIAVKGPKGELSKPLPPGISIKEESSVLTFQRADDSRVNRTNHGMVRAHVANMVKGVSTGWTRELEINGVGYKAEVKGDTLNMSLGFAHPVTYKLPKGVSASVDKNRIIMTGADKDVLGQAASEVRRFRKPEPYKGKGVKYVEETIRRKVGKAGAS